MGTGQLKAPQSSLLLPVFIRFSLVKCSSGCYKPLIPKILKKLILTIFATVLIAFMGEQIFQGLYFTIAEVLLYFSILNSSWFYH